MNYLAHAYLSFNEPEILVGNMISDFVKGKTKFTYLPGIQKGIALHRQIDQFTDEHAATARAKLFFRPTYRLYSGAFVDVLYDHFLATDKNEFRSPAELEMFSAGVYHVLEDKYTELPEVFQHILPHMKKHNWLCSYQHKLGIERSFWGLVNRATYLHEYGIAFSIFNQHYEELKNCYEEFFPELKQFAGIQLRNLLGDDSIYL